MLQMTIFPMSQWGGLPPIINRTAREDIECQQPAVEFLPRECCVNLLPAPKRSPIQRRRHFVSGSSTFSSTWLSGTVVQSAVTVTHMKCCEVSKMVFEKRQSCTSAGTTHMHTHTCKCILHILNVHTQMQQPHWAGMWLRAKGGSSILAWC